MKIGYVHDDAFEGVYFQGDDGSSLGIERAATFDDRDVAAGMDTYCLVLGTGEAVYGGVASWEVDRPGHALLVLTDEAAQALGTEFDAFDIDADPGRLDEVDPIVTHLIRE